MANTYQCSICGRVFSGYGNNPYPVTKGENDRCCDACNDSKVIPARINGLFNKKQGVKENGIN